MAAFVDTNILILIYAFADTASGPIDKVAIARTLLISLFIRNELIVSGQVLGEFSANAIRKGKPPLTIGQVTQRVQELSQQTVVPIEETLVVLALQRVQEAASVTGTP